MGERGLDCSPGRCLAWCWLRHIRLGLARGHAFGFGKRRLGWPVFQSNPPWKWTHVVEESIPRANFPHHARQTFWLTGMAVGMHGASRLSLKLGQHEWVLLWRCYGVCSTWLMASLSQLTGLDPAGMACTSPIGDVLQRVIRTLLPAPCAGSLSTSVI